MNDAEEPRVKELFCHLMNEEKEHVAEFTRIIQANARTPAGRNRLTSAVSRPGPFQPQAHLRNAAGTRLAKNRRVPAAFVPGRE